MSEVQFDLFPRQVECLNVLRNHTYVFFGGARGGGKSHLSRVYLLSRALRYPGTRHLLIRKSFPELQRNHITRFLSDYPWVRYVERTHEIHVNDSIIELGYCESDKDLSKWQGGEYATICLDECQFHTRDIFNFFKTVLRTSSTTGIKPRMLLTGNPGGQRWPKDLFLDHITEPGEDQNDFAYVKSLVYDNPALIKADPNYVERLKSLPPALRSAYLDGDWSVVLGSYFLLTPSMEIDPWDLDQGQLSDLYGSLDHGIAHNTSFGLHWLDRRNHKIQRLFTYMSCGQDSMTHAKEIADRIRAFPHTMGASPTKIYYDPSMANQTRVTNTLVACPLADYQQVFNTLHISTIWEPANNSRIYGSQLMQRYFSGHGQPDYLVWRPYNRDFRSLLSQILVDPHNAEVYLKEETPQDDLADEVRYAITGMHAELMVSDEIAKIKRATKQRQDIHKDWYTV